jgi:hypothetical protein
VPDWQQREALLKRFACGLLGDGLENEKTKAIYLKAAKLAKWEPQIDDKLSKEDKAKRKKAALEEVLKKFDAEFKKIARRTTFFGYGDLKNLVESKTMAKIQPTKAKSDPPTLAEAMNEALGEVDSAVNLSAYRNRFLGQDSPPFEEFFLLVFLFAESDESHKLEIKDEDKEAIYLALDRIPGFQGDKLKVSGQESIKEDDICNKLNTYLGVYFAEWKMRKQLKEEEEARNRGGD